MANNYVTREGPKWRETGRRALVAYSYMFTYHLHFVLFLRTLYVNILFSLVTSLPLPPPTPPMSLSNPFIVITSSIITAVTIPL